MNTYLVRLQSNTAFSIPVRVEGTEMVVEEGGVFAIYDDEILVFVAPFGNVISTQMETPAPRYCAWCGTQIFVTTPRHSDGCPAK
jgi:hypothetical protein